MTLMSGVPRHKRGRANFCSLRVVPASAGSPAHAQIRAASHIRAADSYHFNFGFLTGRQTRYRFAPAVSGVHP